MTSTSLMRQAWAPPCTGPFARMRLHGEGVVSVRASTVEAWLALNAILVKHNYQTRKADTGAYNCRKITGGSNYSLHAYGIAVDLNWQSNPYGRKLITDMPIGMIQDIEAIRTNSGHRVFRWGGRYTGNKDAMHFELICTPLQLKSGIKALLVDASQTPTKPKPEEKEDDIMNEPLEIVKGNDNAWYVTDGITKQWIQNRAHAGILCINRGAKLKVAPASMDSAELNKMAPYEWPQDAVDSIRTVGPKPPS